MESQDLRKVGLKVTHPRMRILELLEQANNFRLRTEADLDRARAAGRGQDRVGEWHYLQRALWNIRAAHRL